MRKNEKQQSKGVFVTVCEGLPLGLTILSEVAGQCDLIGSGCGFSKKAGTHSDYCNKKTFTHLGWSAPA